MGSANSHVEQLERLRIEREMRLGLHAGSTAALNSSRVRMRPANPNQQLSRPVQDRFCGSAVLPAQRQTQLLAQYPQPLPQWPFHGMGVHQHFPPQRPAAPSLQSAAAAAPRRHALSTSPQRESSRRGKSPNPTKLGWVATPPPSNASSSPGLDLLATAQRTWQRLQSHEKRAPQSTSPQRKKRLLGESPPRSPQRANTSRENSSLKPTVKQALYLLSLEELEERTSLLNEEVDMFDVILARFSHAVEMEIIRVAAFEMFDLEKKVRKAILSQEKRERHIVEYWLAENFEDAKLAEGIRRVQSRPNPCRTPSRSPWRFPTSPSKDRHRFATDDANGAEERTFLANPDASPSPIPLEHSSLLQLCLHPQQTTQAPDSRFTVPSRYFDEASEDEENAAKPGARFAPRKHLEFGGRSNLPSGPSTTQWKQAGRGKEESPPLKSKRSSTQHGSLLFEAAATPAEGVRTPQVAPKEVSPESGAVRGTTSDSMEGVRQVSTLADDEHHTPTAAPAKDPARSETKTALSQQGETDSAVADARFKNVTKNATQGKQQHQLDQVGSIEPRSLAREQQGNRAACLPPPPSLPASKAIRAKLQLRAPPTPPVNENREGTHAPVASSARSEAERESVQFDATRSIGAEESSSKASSPSASSVSPQAPHPEAREPHLQLIHPLDDLPPIEQATERDPSVSSTNSSVNMDPFSAVTSRRRVQPSLLSAAWSPELVQRQAELERKIALQRGRMWGSSIPRRAAPPPPISPGEHEQRCDDSAFNDARRESADAVRNRLSALLDASMCSA